MKLRSGIIFNSAMNILNVWRQKIQNVETAFGKDFDIYFGSHGRSHAGSPLEIDKFSRHGRVVLAQWRSQRTTVGWVPIVVVGEGGRLLSESRAREALALEAAAREQREREEQQRAVEEGRQRIIGELIAKKTDFLRGDQSYLTNDDRELIRNPFLFQNKRIAFYGRFESMNRSDAAIFSLRSGDQVVLTGVSPQMLQGIDYALVSGDVIGKNNFAELNNMLFTEIGAAIILPLSLEELVHLGVQFH